METKQMIKQTKFGWVDLSNVKRTKDGRIDWKNSIGCIIPFQYQDIYSTIHIMKYISGRHVCITIHKYASDYQITKSQIINGELGGVLQKITSNFRFHAGDVVNEKILILSSYMNGHRKAYSYQCLIDGYVGSMTEDDLRRGHGCPVCSHRIVMCGINDVVTTHPEVAKLFLDQSDAYKYSAFSKHKAVFKCPNCGNKINAAIYNVVTQGLSCQRCGDGFSYPEKFVFNVLKQISKLHLDILYNDGFETQKSFYWSKNILHNNPKLSGDKIYDFYIPIYGGLLIETHGLHHFEQCLYHTREKDKTLEEERENDSMKYNIAIQNGILPDHYIVLDCRESTIEHIKNSIMSSNLPTLLSFSEDQIDWLECGRFAASSRIIEACSLWNSGVHSTKQIGKTMKMHRTTILRYLRRGEELGIVQDPPKHNKKKTQQNN